MWLIEILRNLGNILRYFASAVVAVVLVWAFDDGHDVFEHAFNLAWPGQQIPPIMPLGWVLVGLLVGLGLFSYFIHRAIHRHITSAILRHYQAEWNPPTPLELDFARWERRGQHRSAARSVQEGLDLLNAATHFFYCSALAPVILAAFLELIAPKYLALPWHFTIILLALFALGLSVDIRAAEYDVAAWRRFNSSPDAVGDSEPGAPGGGIPAPGDRTPRRS